MKKIKKTVRLIGRSYSRGRITLAGRGDIKHLFGVVGDSNADGRGETIPVVPAATLYKWNGTAFDEITTQHVANDINRGSIWQKFAIDYKASTGQSAYLVNGARGGAEFYPNGDNDNWFTTGTLYGSFKTKMTAALADSGASAPKGIFINLGINDYRSANSIANIKTGIDSLLSRLTTDYPGVPILVIQMGRSESGGNGGDERGYDMRSYLVAKAEALEDVHIVGSGAFLIGMSDGYIADNLHYTQASNDILGMQFATWFKNSSISNKWARSVASSCFRSALNANRTTLVANLIKNQYDVGNYFKLEYLCSYCVPSINDFLADWCFLGYGVAGAGLSASTNSHMITNGTNTSFLVFNATTSFYDRAATQSDIIMGVKLRTKSTASGTAATLMGRTDTTYAIRIAQSSTFVNYHVNNLGANQRNTAETTFTAGTLYSVARNGNTEYLIKNADVFDTNTLASDGQVTQAIVIGVNNANGTVSFPFNGTYSYAFMGKYQGFDLASFYADMEYMIAHWND